MTRRRWFLSILFFLIYELIVWLGSYFLAGDSFLLAGLMLTALGITVLIVYILVSRLTKRMAAAQAPPPAPGGEAAGQGPATTAIPSGPDPEIDAVIAQIGEANARLAQSPKLASRRAKTALTDLPMYILAGPEGTGKTSTFLKAGLEPELLAGQVFRDVTILPTRLCNFWYTGEAVFVEASGSLFSQDVGRWARLLQKLRGRKRGSFLRKLMPGKGPKPSNIRGIVLFVDIAPFTGIPDPNRITGLGRRLQERLRAAGESFGTNYPVYVLFTKSDAIPYFTDYFNRITEGEDQQIFGCTLKAEGVASRPTGEVYAEAEGRRLTEAFNSLYYSLADKRVVFLARESQPQERAATYEFPREMKRIRDTLIQFLVDVFRPNPLQPGAILRGFYFTGTRKASASLASETESARRFSSAGEATSFFNLQEYQAKMGIAAQPRSTEQTVDRWCFVSELFHRVILPDPIAKSTSFSDRRLDLYRRIAYGGLAAFAVLLSLLWIRSWFGNRDLIHQAEDAVKLTYDYQPASHGTPSLNSLRSLDAIRQQLAVLQEYDEDGPPFRLRWGLYSGERIRPTLYKLYFQRFREVFFDDFHNSVSLDLAGLPATPDAGAHPFNTVYDRLKAYRMITSCKCTPDKSFLPPVLFGIWNANRSLDPERQELALRQIEFYSDQLRHKNPYQVAEKQEIVDHTRQYLSAFQGADRIYRGMLAGANQAPRQPARVGDIAPNFRQVLTGPGEVDAAFTKAGWDYMQNALKSGNRGSIGEPCVLGGMGFASQATQGSEVTSQIKDLYLRDYIDKWKQFLVATGIEPFRNSGDAAKKLAMLADNRSPLLAAIYLTSENTNYATTPKNAAPAAPKKPSGILQVLKRKFEPAKARQAEQLAREANLKMPAPGAAAPNQPPPGDMSQIFQPVRLVVPPGSKDRLIDAPNQKYMDALNAMQRAMDKISNDRGSTPDMSLHQAAAQASDAGMDAVRQLATKFNIEGTEGVDEQVKRLLEQPFTYSMKFVITDASKITKDKAGAAGKSFCARLTPLEKKFPFNPQSDSDVSIDEFTSVFAPQNSALATLQQALAKVVVKQGRIWAPAPDADTKLTPDFLNFLNRVSSISDAFFANGGPQPAMKYSLKPVGSAGVQSLTLNIDGEHTTGNQAKQFSWPGAPAAQQVELPVKVGATITFASYEGLWGVFRMMNDGDPRAPGSRVVVLSHVRQGRGRPTIVSDASGNPVSIRLEMVDLPNGIDVFDKNFFSVRCPGRVTQ